MTTRICKECKIEKDITEFRKGKDYTSWKCKKCEYEQHKKYVEKNKDKIINYKKQYYVDNIEKIKNYKINNEKHNKMVRKEYKAKHKKEIEKYMQEYRLKNRHKINEASKKYRVKRKEEPLFCLKENVRKIIYNSFKRKSKSKTDKTESILGISIDGFIKYLLQTFRDRYNYEWDGIEKVHIDHIKPLKLAYSEEEVIKLCHYTNLQLLKAKDNLKKGAKYENIPNNNNNNKFNNNSDYTNKREED